MHVCSAYNHMMLHDLVDTCMSTEHMQVSSTVQIHVICMELCWIVYTTVDSCSVSVQQSAWIQTCSICADCSFWNCMLPCVVWTWQYFWCVRLVHSYSEDCWTPGTVWIGLYCHTTLYAYLSYNPQSCSCAMQPLCLPLVKVFNNFQLTAA